jgi:hypothetical protein
MARLKIRYKAVDPYYSTHEQTFIGVNLDDCDNQRFEYDLGGKTMRPQGNGLVSLHDDKTEGKGFFCRAVIEPERK